METLMVSTNNLNISFYILSKCIMFMSKFKKKTMSHYKFLYFTLKKKKNNNNCTCINLTTSIPRVF